MEKIDQSIQSTFNDYFLPYASYVILDRAIPYINDGLKPVQRRILHSMSEKHDGRYHKVANLVGHTMQYHPHGDASIADALVNIAQAGYLIDTQGNWGNIATGDSAAASRYIEARLTPFALEILYNEKLTEWVDSYDGRAKEPVTFPAKFPLSILQGVSGIGVGLATIILPHNPSEIVDASIKYLNNEEFELYPDFPLGGTIDVSNYKDGMSGGKVISRCNVECVNKTTFIIKDLPFGVTTSKLIDSILLANDKGKIKIKKVEDNTSKNVEIVIHTYTGVDADTFIEALYAFTDCEQSISPNTCVIRDNNPAFIGVSEILKHSVDQTKSIISKELEIEMQSLHDKIFYLMCESMFVHKELYSIIKTNDNYFELIKKQLIDLLTAVKNSGKSPYAIFIKDTVDDSIVKKLCDMPIRKISTMELDSNKSKMNEYSSEYVIAQTKLTNIVETTIKWYSDLKAKYFKDVTRNSVIKEMNKVLAHRVSIANMKFYVNKEDGFVGTDLKKDEYLFDVSDLDDVAIITNSGNLIVKKVCDKSFVEKNILSVTKYDKISDNMVYTLIYSVYEQEFGYDICYIKKFKIGGITRDKAVNIVGGHENVKILFFSAHTVETKEMVKCIHVPRKKMRNVEFEYDTSELAIKGRNSNGNRLSRYEIQEIKQI